MTIIVHTGSSWVMIVGVSSVDLSQRLLVWSDGSLDLLASTRWELANHDWALSELSRLGVNPSVVVHAGGVMVVVEGISLVSVVMMVMLRVA